MRRSRIQKLKDFVTFPLRAVTLFLDDRWGFSSLRSERFDYAASEVKGYCLDVGCGPGDEFVRNYLDGNGKGVDVFAYKGLSEENLVMDNRRFPFPDGSFGTVTFIASLNHIPKPLRDAELAEAYRCLKRGGNIVVTMGNPLAEILVHKLVWFYDKVFGTHLDMDSERGMEEEEDYFLTNSEICSRLSRAGFKEIRIRYFLTQWGLNHLMVALKR